MVFGDLPNIRNTKWDYFKDNDQPVSVIDNGVKYFGKVCEINQTQKYVKLQPALFANACGTELCLRNKPIFVPFNSVPISIAEDSLEVSAQSWNKAKLQEKKEKLKNQPTNNHS